MEAKIQELVTSLIEKTGRKEANWSKVGKAEKFSLILDTGKVMIEKGVTQKGNLYFQLAILNDSGEGILNVAAVRKGDLPFQEPDYELLSALHDVVKKMYFKVDETLTGLLNESKKEGTIGKPKEPGEDLPF